MIQCREFGSEMLEDVKRIFSEEEWIAYLENDESLKKAFDRSLYTLGAFEEDKLVGFVRCVGDGEHVVFVQDLIVDKAHRGAGVGKMLFRAAWDKFSSVRMFQVNTDLSDEKANRFYQSFGMVPLEKGYMISYFR